MWRRISEDYFVLKNVLNIFLYIGVFLVVVLFGGVSKMISVDVVGCLFSKIKE